VPDHVDEDRRKVAVTRFAAEIQRELEFDALEPN
jgi:hypothetical protein